jgi:hypothetical protein
MLPSACLVVRGLYPGRAACERSDKKGRKRLAITP